MPSIRQLYEIKPPFLGFFSGYNPGTPQYFTKCYNVQFDKAGNPGKRYGFHKEDQTPAAIPGEPIDGMFLYTRQGTSGSPTSRTIIHAGGSIFSVPNGAYLQTQTAIKTGMTSDKTVDHAVLSDKYFCANGSQVLQYYDGTTIANITTPPASGLTGTFTPAIIEVHRWSLWAAGVPGNPSRLFKSVPQDGTDFNTNLAAFDVTDGYALSGASQVDVRPDDGTKITDMVGDHFGQLIVFKENSIHRLVGATKADFMLPPEGVIDGIGAIRGSVVRANNDIYFASRKGIHRLSTVEQYGDNKESYISYPIQEYYEGLDKFNMTSMCAAVHWSEQNIILWSFPIAGSSKNNVLLVYNYAVGEAGAWSVWTGPKVSSMAIFRFDWANTLYIGDYSGNIARSNPWGRDDLGASYDMEIEFSFDAGSAVTWKGWRDLLLTYNPVGGMIEVKTKVDEQAWGTKNTVIPPVNDSVLGEFTLDSSYLANESRVDVQRVMINKSGRTLWVNIKNTTMGEKLTLLGFLAEWVPSGTRQRR